MRVRTVEIDGAAPADLVGTVLCHTVARTADGRGIAFRKGHIFRPEDLPALAALGPRRLRVLELAPDDLHEDEAGRRLAQAIAGPGVTITGPSQSRFNLLAAHPGLLRIEVGLLERLNRLDGVAVFTLFDRQVVPAGELVAGAKVTPLAVPLATIRAVEALCAAEGPVVSVRPFRPARVGVVVKEVIDDRQRQRFEQVLTRKVRWFGATIGGIVYVADAPEAVAEALRAQRAAGAEVLLTAGTNAADPDDAFFVALRHLGAAPLRHGAPAHPGSFFWLAYWQGVPIFGLPSCGLYAEGTLADLLLPRVLAGEVITLADLAALGHGGLLRPEMAFRFPPYGLTAEADAPHGESPEALSAPGG